MTEDLIAMAREAGFFLYDLTETHGVKTVESDDVDQWAQLERFAALIDARAVARTREECAKVCDDKAEVRRAQGFPREFSSARACAAAIRALGERT